MRIEKEAQEIGALVKNIKKNTCIFMLVALQSIINEQITTKRLAILEPPKCY